MGRAWAPHEGVPKIGAQARPMTAMGRERAGFHRQVPKIGFHSPPHDGDGT